MTAFTPDRPDWTKEDTASIVYQQSGPLAPGDSFTFGLVGVASYILLAIGGSADTPVILTLLYESVPGASFPITELGVSAQDDPAGPSLVVYESPSYGGVLTVTNIAGMGTVLLNVFSSNRTVAEPRYITDSTPGRTFTSTAGFVSATPQNVPFVDNGPGGYAANVIAGITVKSTGAGDLFFYYRDLAGNQQIIPIATIVGGVVSTVTVPLPECVGQFWFTPTNTDPAGEITVLAYPARS